MSGFLGWIKSGGSDGLTVVLVVATLIADVNVIYQIHGFLWAAGSVILFPVTMVAAPILALDPENAEKMTGTTSVAPAILTGVLVLWLVVVAIAKSQKSGAEIETEKIERERFWQAEMIKMDARIKERVDTRYRETDRLYALVPNLEEMLNILDASHVVNGEIEMDYAKFNQILSETRRELRVLRIYLPNLNEGGDSVIFRRALREVMECAWAADVEGARRAWVR